MYIFHSSYFFQLRFFNLPGVRFPTKLTWTPTLRRPKPKELRQREMCKYFYSLSKYKKKQETSPIVHSLSYDKKLGEKFRR